MRWNDGKFLDSDRPIRDFEGMAGFRFPESFKALVMEHDGGRPANGRFDTDYARGRKLWKLLSFSGEDIKRVWFWHHDELDGQYVPFALDGEGNLICFEACSGRVVFKEQGSLFFELAAADFGHFLEGLYE